MNDTYCVLPFIQMSTSRSGDYIPCSSSLQPTGYNVGTTDVATVWTSDYYKKLRNDLLNGVRNPNCQTCWEAEDLKFTSKRQKQNGYHTNYKEPLPQPDILDIKTGNACNLKCITCNQLSSSQIDKEVNEWKEQGKTIPIWLEEVGEQFKVFNPTNIESIPANLDPALQTASVLQIHGGEPFASPLTIGLLDHCIEKDYLKLSISLITNLTSLSSKLLDKLNLFPNSHIVVSYDHINDEKFKFIRYPATHQQFSKNLKTLISNNTFNWGISFTISIFNALDIEEIFLEFEKLSYTNKFKTLSINPVVEPGYFCIRYLEPEQKQQLITSIEKVIQTCPNLCKQKDVVDALTELYKIKDDNPDDFKMVVKERTRVLNLYDETRGTNWRKLFPYIKE